MNDRIKQLQKEIELERIKMDNCVHVFSDPYYNPEDVSVGYGSVQDGAGSDPHWSYAGYRTEKVDRWSRVCEKCGYTQHTYKQEPIVSGYKPKF